MNTHNHNAMISIGNSEFPIVEYQGRRVITLAMVDQIHQRPVGTASRNFGANRERFLDREDFYLVDFSKKDEFRSFDIEIPTRGLTLLTESGYLMLVKSFTDDLAWKVQRELVNRYFRTAPTSTAHQLYLMAKANWEQEQRVNQLAQFQHNQQQQLDAIAQRQSDMDGDTGYMTALAYCRKESIPAPLAYAKQLGIKASEMCRNLAIRMGQVPDERWGSVNSYPIEILRECHQGMKGA
ncbi:hypothetical protein Mmc1_2768 [Magnetococcus marinus MC-1]|uniref:KilA-N DNA-binding domain-containing protein n=1 Tax=Magnetococcus marinus (strain ATCC BAA-1437 / JCM 17883 / MC-1) TaxID=156889 RepID=A0LBB8_MAGMM|nr:ORF6N domain-containing protein [Magnetococcus marinus]ABK45261.1 hypothetical protein Mmc1_2768 [Magnetococcus marinus MC-1]